MDDPKVTPPEGIHPESLPPDFSGWDDPHPTHPAGRITAYDEQSGLPIVRRSQSSAPLEKGQSVEMQDGTKGKIAHMVAGMQTARVRTEDGRNLTVRHSTLKPAGQFTAPKSGHRLNPGDAVTLGEHSGKVSGMQNGKIQVEWNG